MLDFLTDYELEQLLEIANASSVFLYVVTKDNQPKILTMDYNQAAELLGLTTDINISQIIDKMAELGNRVEVSAASQDELVKLLQKRYLELKTQSQELEFIKEYLNMYPEYII